MACSGTALTLQLLNNERSNFGTGKYASRPELKTCRALSLFCNSPTTTALDYVSSHSVNIPCHAKGVKYKEPSMPDAHDVTKANAKWTVRFERNYALEEERMPVRSKQRFYRPQENNIW
jgi:hypothetical protein